MKTTRKCEAHGVNMVRAISFYVFFVSGICASEAGEFGNVFFPSNQNIEQQTRDASAAAIRGLQNIMTALESSELRRIDSRTESLLSGSNTLHIAAQAMTNINLGEAANVPIRLDQIGESDKGYLLFMRRDVLHRNGLPATIGEIYKDFIDMTEQLSITMKESAASKEPILPREVVRNTARYLAFGDLVSAVIRATVSSK